MSFNEREIRYLYEFLNHGPYQSRVHCQDPNKKGPAGVLSSTLIKGADALVAWAKAWDGKGNCYISRNGLLSWNKPAPFTALSFDIDSIYEKSKGATNVESETANLAGKRILERCPGGALASTGNGVLLLFRLSPNLTRTLNGTLQGAYLRLTQELKGWIENECKLKGRPVSLDVLADPERLIRLIGTKNVKGLPENHRYSKFLYIPTVLQRERSPIIAQLQALATAPKSTHVLSDKPAYEPWVTTALEGLPARGKHNTIIRLAGYFGAKHIPIEITKKLILEANANAKDEPADDADVIYRIDDVYKRIKSGRYSSDEPDVTPQADFTVGSLHEPGRAYMDDLKQRSTFITPEIPWPFEDVNKMTWGLPRGTITVLGAWTGNGKTSIAMTLAEHVTRIGKKVLYFPTEMPQKEIKDRFISVATGIWNLHLFNGKVITNEADKKKLEEFLPTLENNGFLLPKTDMPRLSLYALKRSLDLAKPDLLIVDFLQRLSAKETSRRREVGEFIMTIKDEVAKRQIACLVLSQFHRPDKSQNGKFFPPTKFDFAECGDIENTSDIALLLHPPLDERGYVVESNNGERFKPVMCNVAKNRHAGTTGTTYLRVDTLTTKFTQV